ncbi:hypothetical protein [Promicromonospora sp. MEB111]|uniref:hypothetical protein n=1 Tax=Promicromonospora sp. MEB111 TaxID=3040301 RepID=UPI00254A3204|nr:hypothetical protein [Promicromonospora sp. MEB111]
MSATDIELLAVVASKVDDLRTDVGELRDAVNASVETKVEVQSTKVEVKALTDRVVDLEGSQRWLSRTVAGALIVAILSAVVALPV